MVAGFAAGRSLVPADELPHADPVLLRALYAATAATAATATDTTRRQGRSPRIKRPISERPSYPSFFAPRAQPILKRPGLIAITVPSAIVAARPISK